MPIQNQKIGEILVHHNYISEEEMNSALEQSKKTGDDFVEILMEQGIMTPQLVESAMAEHYKLDYYDIQSNPPDTETVASLPEEVAKKYQCIILKREKDSITVAVLDPETEGLEDAIRNNLGKQETDLSAENKEEKSEKENEEEKEYGEQWNKKLRHLVFLA
jgi:hypothetical protein